MSGRVVRIFLSSTFRDFGEERDLLVRKVFPTLRAKLQSRFVDLVDVDLRWGITEEEAERGEVLPICLSEIDRARPYFIGFLGERYGWVPPPDAYPSHVLESQSWLEEHRGGKSVTELEILHGVLNNPHMEGRALFYLRSFEYSLSKGGDYVASSPEDEARQSALKETIRQSGFPVYEDYKSPEHLAELLEKDLWEILDREFPASDIPDAFVRENVQHEAYALPRQRLYIGGGKYLTALDKALSEGNQWILVDGPSGGGKSALLANWLQSVRDSNKNIAVHAHYLGATADATDPVFLVRRLIECIKRKTESTEDLASDPDELLDSLPIWLANASSWCELRGKKFLFVIDALNGLTDRRDLRWFPRMLPKHIHLVVSTLPGEVNDVLQERATWSKVSVMPLDAKTAELVFTSYLALFNKTLPDKLVKHVMAHKLSVNPLFLLTLAEELRLFGEHEQLSNRLDHYLTSLTVDDLFERVLERIERDYGANTLREIMTALWAARSGLREEEILGYSDLKPMHWAYIRNALGPTLIDASGRLIFAHDYMRIAVSDRYMAGNNKVGNEGQSEEALNLRRVAHKKLVRWFEKYAFQDGQGLVSDERAAEEIPYQWQQAQEWKKLQATLTKQKMLVAILRHRSEQELLSYWIKLEANIKTDIETQYETAWKKWQLNKHEEATGDIAEELSDFLIYAGRYKKFAEKILRVAVANRLFHSNEQSKNYVRARGKLAELLSIKEKFSEAIEIYRDTINRTVEIYGPITDEVANEKSGMADVASLDQNESGVLLREALLIRETIYGRDHLNTANDLLALGSFLWNTSNGDNTEARKLIQRAVDIYSSELGKDSPSTAGALSQLAIFMMDIEKDYVEAEPLLMTSLGTMNKILGPEHPRSAKVLNNLGHLYSWTGRYDDAIKIYREDLRIKENRFEKSSIDVAQSLNSLAMTLNDVGCYSEAETLFRRANTIVSEKLGKKHSWAISSKHSIGVLLSYKGDLSSAEKIFDEVNQLEGDNSISPKLQALSWRVDKLKKDKDYEQAIDLSLQLISLEIYELGPTHINLAATYYNLAEIFEDLEEYNEASFYFEKCLEIEQEELGLEEFELHSTYISLAKCQMQQANFYDAEKNLQKALSLQITQYSEQDIELKHVLELLRDVSIALSQDTEAQYFVEKIMSLEK
nr:tetratricopeptide repeat protein [Yoonia sp.]